MNTKFASGACECSTTWKGSETIKAWEATYLKMLELKSVSRIMAAIYGPSSKLVMSKALNGDKLDINLADQVIREEATEIILGGEEERAKKELKRADRELFSKYLDEYVAADGVYEETKDEEVRKWLEFVDDTSYILNLSEYLLRNPSA